VYLLNPITQVILDMTIVPGIMNGTVDRLHFCQVEQFLVVQDGVGVALIIDDTASAKAVANQTPTGTVMCYCHGRLFIKTAARNFIAGNINMPNAPTNVLDFTETQYLAGGGFTGSFTDGNGASVTVTGGIITDVS